ncbi:DNA mismatch repair protein MutS [Brasilonema octagenarum UFV-E1]|uniref:DNA mismatch repair protein MutS n=1 Tax=Brasilonema sennae CENA114 TaxID=415709 RepID=A0A856M818_9CYAN|nr:DNA mismatch repair protein MutS [Brasilonema sennae]QDL07293.1 DNA mismatch repair protein MutS [Brasilonema sennae CENA114]QDL13657.1 DNA mismatch repair protein MutS [Brasilonema octagenarum UFV-E1]
MSASYSASQTTQPSNPTAPHADHRLVDRSKLTQMFQHYVDIKDKYPHAMLLYRVGDFFECYFEDAVTLAQELELSLTSKLVGDVGRVAMSGVPHHAWERHATQLVEKGYAVVICDQVEDAAEAAGRLVRREVTRILTPGTLLEEGMLKSSRNNYLAAVVIAGEHWGLAYADISTGEFLTTQGSNLEHLTQELMRLQPAEVLVPTNAPDLRSLLLRAGEKSEHLPECLPPSFCYCLRSQIPFSQAEARARLLQKFKVRSLEGLGCDQLPLAVRAAGGLLEYLEDTQKENAIPLQLLRTYTLTDFLIVDYQTRRNLEITQTVRDGSFVGSLLWALDRTSTAMGSRALRRWLLQPLLDVKGIRSRQDTIQELVENTTLRQELRQLLRQIYDLERLTGRAGSGTAHARDLVALADSLSRLPELSRLVASAHSPFLKALQKVPPVLEELAQKIRAHLVESPPIHIKEGGLIRSGINTQLDERRATVEDDQKWIANLEVDERAKTGIPTLKVGFNKTFGYYISISRAKADQVPSNYIRKQTLVNEERYITPELKEREARILTARDDLNQLEYEIFVALREEVGGEAEVIRNISRAVAAADVLCGLAELAVYQGYCRPEMVEGREINIVDGRHPVVEQSLPAGFFVPNSTSLGGETNRRGAENAEEEEEKGRKRQGERGGKESSLIPSLPDSPHPDLIILTGPNASGKSCYLRQVGLIQLMAQIGSFVPAGSARLGVCDRIFTRVGAVDDLATGQSTFMVEMNETANILNHATSRSLVLLDEIGRGTATFDGLSIAWAVAEYIATEILARTIFATHYHELNELASLLPNIANYQVTVKELADQIIFLHQVQPGGADKSYGIEAGRLAGLPKVVIARAKQVMGQIEKHSKIAMGLQNLE